MRRFRHGPRGAWTVGRRRSLETGGPRSGCPRRRSGRGWCGRGRGSRGRAWHSRAGRSRTWHSRPWHSRAWRSRPWHSRPWHSRPWHSRPWRSRTWHSRAWHGRTWHSRAWHSRGACAGRRAGQVVDRHADAAWASGGVAGLRGRGRRAEPAAHRAPPERGGDQGGAQEQVHDADEGVRAPPEAIQALAGACAGVLFAGPERQADPVHAEDDDQRGHTEGQPDRDSHGFTTYHCVAPDASAASRPWHLGRAAGGDRWTIVGAGGPRSLAPRAAS